VFGDLNDAKSEVAKKHNKPRSYELLQELNNKPRLRYLARISNPHPDLVSEEHGTQEQDHGSSDGH
jgi:molybdopterin-containing oxidoreductase family iron-sulfur binding subunit